MKFLFEYIQMVGVIAQTNETQIQDHTMNHFSKLLCITTVAIFWHASGEWNNAQDIKPKVKIGRDTTYVDGPLTKDGYIDYIAHFNKVLSDGVTPQNNAAVLLVQTYPGEITSEKFMKRFCKALGIKPVPLDGDHYEDLFKFLRRRDGITENTTPEERKRLADKHEAIWERVMADVWTAESHPEVKEWLDENKKHFDTVRRASLRKRYYHPMLSDDDDDSTMLIAVLLPQIQSSREYARALTIRSNYYLGIGENEKCVEDILTMRRLGNLIAQGGTLVEQLVGIAILGIAQSVEERVALSGKLTSKELLAYRAKMSKTRAASNVLKSFNEFERLTYLDSVQQVMKGGMRSLNLMMGGGETQQTRMKELLDRVVTSSTDWTVTMQIGNKMFDKFSDTLKTDDWIERGKAMASLEEELKKMSASIDTTTAIQAFLGGPEFRGKMMGRIFVSLLMPALSAVTEAEHRAQISDDLSYFVLSIAAFKDEVGRYPNSLGELSEKIDGNYPIDRYSNKDFLYRSNGDGFIVYSVGKNGKDNNGDGVFNEKYSNNTDDFGRGYQSSKPPENAAK